MTEVAMALAGVQLAWCTGLPEGSVILRTEDSTVVLFNGRVYGPFTAAEWNRLAKGAHP